MPLQAYFPSGYLPHRYNKRILLAVIGLTPQVITETIYALAHLTNPFYPTELHIITTHEGFSRVRLTLLGDHPAWLTRLKQDYSLPHISFDESNIHVLTNEQGAVLDDIRTDADNECLADTITRTIAQLTQDSDCALHVSLAGGRKTMGYYAGYALSLFARPQDRLSHILVSSPFESHPDFYYPTPYRNIIYTRDQKPLDTQEALVSLAQIPFVRLRHELPCELLAGKLTFSQTVEKAQSALAPLSLVFNVEDKQIIAGGKHLALSPILIAFYWLFINDRLIGSTGIHYTTTDDLTIRFLHNYALLVGIHSGDFVQTEQALAREGIDKAYFEEKLSRIKKAFEMALGKEGAKPYLPTQLKRNAPKFLTLPIEAILIVKEK
jgi:CRISPR-associated protein (TIGR02584 family)